jgi:hypothetical protein
MLLTLLIITLGFSRLSSEALSISLLLLFLILPIGYTQDSSSSNTNDIKREGQWQGQDNIADNNFISVTIPRGSANPEVDITNLAPRQWYVPRQITINEQDIVNWINKDTETHHSHKWHGSWN